MLSGRDAGAGGRGVRVGLARELTPQRGVGHPLAKGAERLQYGFFVDEDPYVSGAFVASKAIAPPVGKCVDYRSFKKTENVFGDEKLQDAAYEAVRRFMR